MLQAIFICAIAILVLFVLSWYRYYFKCMKDLGAVPGPKPWPLLGNALLFRDAKSLLPTFTRLVDYYGPLIKFMIGTDPSITVADYKTLETVLSSTKFIEKSRHYRYMKNWLGTGLLISSGNKWKQRRKIITPTYHFQILEKFVDVFDSVTNVLINELRTCTKEEKTDVYPLITLCALDIICETAMGTSVDAQIHKNSDYVLSIKEMGQIMMDRTFSALQQNDFLYQFSDNYRKENKSLKIMNDYVMGVIRARRKQHNESKSDFMEEKKEKVAFLDLLLQTSIDGVPLSDEDIREEVATFMFEGHDTVASAISFALYCIANNPEVQKEIIDEQLTIFGSYKDKPANYRDLNEMKYLELVIKETLRLYPSVPFFGRETCDEIYINDSIKLPKGFSITIFAYGIQRDPTYFPEPEVFKPERFLPTNNLGKFPYSFIPFSAGPRNCIGQKFALLEMKATLSKILRNFVLESANHQLELVAETILKSSNGIVISVREREWPM